MLYFDFGKLFHSFFTFCPYASEMKRKKAHSKTLCFNEQMLDGSLSMYLNYLSDFHLWLKIKDNISNLQYTVASRGSQLVMKSA